MRNSLYIGQKPKCKYETDSLDNIKFVTRKQTKFVNIKPEIPNAC